MATAPQVSDTDGMLPRRSYPPITVTLGQFRRAPGEIHRRWLAPGRSVMVVGPYRSPMVIRRIIRDADERRAGRSRPRAQL